MTTLTVVGAGMMGAALCVPWADRGHEVRLLATHLEAEVYAALSQGQPHPKLGLQLPNSVRAYPFERLDEAMAGVDVIALGVSSAGVRWATETVGPFVRADVPLFMITKGLVWDGDKLTALPDVVQAGLPPAVRDQVHPAAVAGPCIAGELARRVPSCVVLTGRDQSVLDRIADLARTDYYHVSTSTDVLGIEACAALKNAYAMGCAFGRGLEEKLGIEHGSIAMHNYESAVFAQSLVEMLRIVKSMGGTTDSVVGLAGVGDLDVTLNGGRTATFGRLLGRGVSFSEAVAAMHGATLECVEIIRVMREATDVLRARGAELPTPLLDHMAEVVLDGAPVDVPFDRFFT